MKAYKRVCVDLFSGLGGFSQAFLDRGWTVYRYDNDKQFAKVPCTHIVDVWDLTPEIIKGKHETIDILLISPPCNCFSPLTIGHYWKAGRPDERAKEAIRLVKRALWLKDQINPRFWILENPAGMLKYVLGLPSVLTWWAAWGSDYFKPTHLWGIMPAIDWPRRPRPGEYIACERGGKVGIQDKKLTSAERALIPYDFSKALCESIEQNRGGQLTLLETLE